MQSFVTTPERFWHTLQRPELRRPLRVARRLAALEGKRYMPMAASLLAQHIVERGYDGATLDQVYRNRSTAASPLARIADRALLGLPVHAALRERHEAMTGEICSAAVLAVRDGEAEFRVLASPVGAGSEIFAVRDALAERRPDTWRRIVWTGVDPDLHDDALTLTGKRLAAARVACRLLRGGAGVESELKKITDEQGRFHLACCPGISDRGALRLTARLRSTAELLQPGGHLLFDRWESAPAASLSEGLRIRFQPVSANEAETALAEAGLELVRQHPTAEGGCVVVLARRIGERSSD